MAESAESFCVSFTAASGPVYQAYKTARQTVFERIHTRIDWTMLKATLGLAYHLIERSFPDLDPVPIIAYMTDTELIRVAQMAESRPKDTRLPLAAFADAGMGFTEIIERLAAVKSCPTRLYYSSAPASTKRRPPET